MVSSNNTSTAGTLPVDPSPPGGAHQWGPLSLCVIGAPLACWGPSLGLTVRCPPVSWKGGWGGWGPEGSLRHCWLSVAAEASHFLSCQERWLCQHFGLVVTKARGSMGMALRVRHLEGVFSLAWQTGLQWCSFNPLVLVFKTAAISQGTMVLFKGTMHQFRQFFNVPNMTFSTFNIKFDIWTKIKVNIFSCEMILWLLSKEPN